VLKRSIWVALRYPLFGVGLGNFHHKSVQELGTHNAYTQVASEMGIPAMIAYIIFLVHPLRKLRMIERELFERNENSRFYYLSIGLQASLVGYMVASFFAAVAYQWYIYYLVAYAIALRRIYYLEEIKKTPLNKATDLEG
jgi:O-antigen ligase